MRTFPQCNHDFMNRIEANDMIWVRPLAIMDEGRNYNNFTKMGWANEREGIRSNSNKKTCLCRLKCLNLVTRTTVD